MLSISAKTESIVSEKFGSIVGETVSWFERKELFQKLHLTLKRETDYVIIKMFKFNKININIYEMIKLHYIL